MIKEGIDTLVALTQAAYQQPDMHTPVLLVPPGAKLESLEAYGVTPVRLKSTYRTPMVSEFIAYVSAHREAATAVFVDPATLSAVAVLDYFDLHEREPGFGQARAQLALRKTPQYEALLRLCEPKREWSQKELVRWLEDWGEYCQFSLAGASMPLAEVIFAVRRMKVDAGSTRMSEVQDYSAQKTSLERIEAVGEKPLPDRLVLQAPMFFDTEPEALTARLLVELGQDPMAFRANLINEELAQRAVAKQIEGEIRGGLEGVAVYLGVVEK